ncbi:phosphoribosylanthranilate isomerase [Fulvivirgaceae bacterium BMA10]|uniref:N-(5'-phosphoribosyl)anthranilate isomerase n=1 Tax=Splendidivirga corallicola TaxID=3051826 RepID=A0ABT8KIP0_9BACT|nr:phosphoribosylanthranilate isomerase [Fulvivirgaceae bacterium BMA10]
MKPRVKICCIKDENEASMAIEFGASALGLVGEMPSGPGVIPDEDIRNIARKVSPPVATFLLTSKTKANDIISHHQLVHTNTIQIVDQLTEGNYQDIRNALPGIKLVQVVHVMGEESIDEALAIAEEVDAILLDSGNPGLSTKVLGGTGKTHNWKISRKLVETVKVPVFLAGGLSPENVKKAINEVQPFGLDLCSGVRTDDRLDPVKLEKFFEAVYNTSR